MIPVLDVPIPVLGINVKQVKRVIHFFKDKPMTILIERSRRDLSIDMVV